MRILVVVAMMLALPIALSSCAKAAESGAEENLLIAPEYYEVSGVAAGDMLNIRAEPDAHADIVGTLPPGASPVEVIAVTDGPTRWGKVVAGDGVGWVSMAYLAEVDPARVPGTPIPTQTVCAGTEPFWSLTFSADSMSFEAPDVAATTLSLSSSGAFVARSHRFYAVAGDSANGMSAVVSSGEYCSDGMSDRDYGWSIDLLRSDGGKVSGYTGCCTRAIDE
ncbi:MAG: SH3 domain-containing protein [Flavobacteriaceae bacterium]